MGWSWPFSSGGSSDHQSSSPTTEDASKARGIALTDEQRIRIFGKPGPAQAVTNSTREQQADAELDAFIKSFSPASDNGNPNNHQSNAATTSNPQTAQPVPASSSTLPPRDYDRVLPDGSLDISPAALYPRAMSCRQAFDQAFYCQSLGGKFNDIYRFGALQSCSEQWAAFWFCMRTRTLPDAERARAVAEHYAARDESRRAARGSSEDVWPLRTVAVRRAFWKDPDAPDGEEDGGAVRTTS